MHALPDLLQSKPIREAVDRLEALELSRRTLLESLVWLRANAERAQVGRSGRTVERARRVAECLVIDGPPRESSMDKPEWYAAQDEWLWFVPGMTDANRLVRDGASELSLHALAIMRNVKIAETKARIDMSKARISTRNQQEANNPQALALRRARSRVTATRQRLTRQRNKLDVLRKRLDSMVQWQRPAQEWRVEPLEKRIAATTLLLSQKEAELRALSTPT